ncbi:MAG TPA: hypothetical protein VK207_07145 [Bacteroidales bacterium]|nr:hypothetical protein [Bacteroidales bacterium]
MNSGIFWIITGSIVGFGIAAISADVLKLKRNLFLLLYVPAVAAVFTFFILRNNISLQQSITHNLYWGLLGAALAGIFVIKNVLSQPSSPRSKGGAFIIDILWPGLTYGLMDSLLLSVLPILALRLTLTGSVWNDTIAGRIGFGAIAMAASFFITTVYHAGFPEFRGRRIIWPNVGNGVLSLAYLLTMNPLAAILPHMAMHVAAMVHGRESTGQVPPHYTENQERH